MAGAILVGWGGGNGEVGRWWSEKPLYIELNSKNPPCFLAFAHTVPSAWNVLLLLFAYPSIESQ